MIRLFALIASIIAGSALSAAPITQDEFRQLVLDRQVHRLEVVMSEAQAAYNAGEVDAEHLRDLNMVFVTTSPKIREVAEDWLKKYPQSPYALTMNAWIENEIAWTLRGNSYAHNVYHGAWPAFYAAIGDAATHIKKAYKLDPTYLPASDGMINLSIVGAIDLDARIIIHKVMTEQPNAGTLLRGLRVADRGWGGSYKAGKRLCDVYSGNVVKWGDQAHDICMIHMMFKMTNWEPKEEFAKLLMRTDHPAIQDIRQQVVLRTDATYQWPQVAEKYGFPKEEWRQDLIELVNSEDFSDLKMALTYDQVFTAYTDLEMVTDKVRPRARAKAKAVLEYDPYNLEAISILLSNQAYKREPDGFSGYTQRAHVLTEEERFDLQKRRAVARHWSSGDMYSLASFYGTSLANFAEFQTSYDLGANAVVYANHSENYLRLFFENFGSLRHDFQKRQEGKGSSRYDWTQSPDMEAKVFCPMSRAKVMYDQICSGEYGQRQANSRCGEPIFKAEVIDQIVEKMKNSKQCVLSSTTDFNDLMFTPVDIDVMALRFPTHKLHRSYP